MEWLLVIIMGFFGFGIGRAIKLYYLNRDLAEYSRNLKFPLWGMAITFFGGGLMHRFAGMPAPVDNWVTWVVLLGPFIGALCADEASLRIGQ